MSSVHDLLEQERKDAEFRQKVMSDLINKGNELTDLIHQFAANPTSKNMFAVFDAAGATEIYLRGGK